MSNEQQNNALALLASPEFQAQVVKGVVRAVVEDWERSIEQCAANLQYMADTGLRREVV